MSDIKYRPELDGLRGIAVAAVVALHTWNVFPNAFICADAFFVLSGFLISTIIIKGVAAGRFSLRDFYIRRVRRVLPLLVAALVTCALIGFFSLPPVLRSWFKQQLLASVAFGTNFYAMSQEGIFSSRALNYPLIHFWSLAIEEQFYVFWPIVLSIAARRKIALWVCMLIGFASGVAFSLSVDNMSVIYFSTFTRVWEFMAGGIVAYFATKQRPSAGRASLLAEGLSAAALLRLVWMTLPPTASSGVLLVVEAVLATCVLIWLSPRTRVAQLLSMPPLRYLGLISFSLYVWHWPMLSFQSILFPTASPFWKLALVVLMLVVSTLSYQFIEMPFREVGPSSAGGRFSKCPVLLWPATLIAMAAMVFGFF